MDEQLTNECEDGGTVNSQQSQIDDWIQIQEEIASQVKVLKSPHLSYMDDINLVSGCCGDHNNNNNNNKTTINKFIRAISIQELTRMSSVNDTKSLSSNSTMMTYYGGVDVGFPEYGNNNDQAVAVYVVIQVDRCCGCNNRRFNKRQTTVYTAYEWFDITVPYICSFLAFREMDPLIRLIQQQQQVRPDLTPQLILVDGNGVWHCRNSGIASCLGIRTGIPTIGVGKSVYCCRGWDTTLVDCAVFLGLRETTNAAATDYNDIDELEYMKDFVWFYKLLRINDKDLLSAKEKNYKSTIGSIARSFIEKLSMMKKCIGVAIPMEAMLANGKSVQMCALVGHGGRIKPFQASTNPIFISVGHNISLQYAVAVVAQLSEVRIPEPIRRADLLGRAMLRERRANKACD